MVRHVRAAQYEEVPRPIIAVSNDYPAGHLHPPHRHRRAQLLHGGGGTMIVSTEHGSWVVPPQQAIWIPPGVLHGIRMVGRVTTHSVYLEPGSVERLSDRCRIIRIPSLMHNLLREAAVVPVEYELGSRADMLMALLLREIEDARLLPVGLPFPSDARLARLCRDYVDSPSNSTIAEWSAALGMSRRSFTRMFRAQTGLSFAAWRRQACLLAAVSRLSAGELVTTVAMDLGYASPAAFSSMFKRVLGQPPSRYDGGRDRFVPRRSIE